MSTRIQSTMLAMGLLSCGLLTGCMTRPYDGEVVGDSVHDSIHVSGWLAQPRKKVTIQARRDASQSWMTIGVAYSEQGYLPWDGRKWHRWVTKLVVPSSRWGLAIHKNALAGRTELRALVDGQPIVTFDEVAEARIDRDPSLTLGELLQCCAAGDKVAVFVQ